MKSKLKEYFNFKDNIGEGDTIEISAFINIFFYGKKGFDENYPIFINRKISIGKNSPILFIMELLNIQYLKFYNETKMTNSSFIFDHEIIYGDGIVPYYRNKKKEDLMLMKDTNIKNGEAIIINMKII